MPDSTAPVVLAFLACEKVLRDPNTNSLSVRNIMWRVYAPSIPSTMKTICGYACITGMRRPYNVQARLVRVTDESLEAEELAASRDLRATPRGPLEDIEIGLCMEDVVLPSTGWYRLLLEVDGVMIAERKLEVRELTT